MATASPTASSSEASSVADAPVPARWAASSTGSGRPAASGRGTGLARHGGGDHAVGAALQRVGDRDGRDRARGVLQGGEQGGDRARRDQRPRCIVHQHDIRRLRNQRFQAGADAVLARGARRDRRQVRRRPRARLRWRPASPTGCSMSACSASVFGGVADHRLAGERQKLLRRFRAEPAAGAGRDQDGCNSHSTAALPWRSE